MRLIKDELVLSVAVLLVRFSAALADIPANDACETANKVFPNFSVEDFGLGLGLSVGVTVYGQSTINATTTNKANFCGENFVNSPGVWYRYRFDTYEDVDIPLVVQASTCSSETDFDTALTVYSGDCSDLKCVGGKDDDSECGNGGTDEHSTVAWHADRRKDYYIYVHGSQANHTGNFEISITGTEAIVPSDSEDENEVNSVAMLSKVSGTLLTLLVGTWLVVLV